MSSKISEKMSAVIIIRFILAFYFSNANDCLPFADVYGIITHNERDKT